MQERVYQKPVTDAERMKQRLIETWSEGIHQSVTGRTTDQQRDHKLSICQS